MAALQDAYAESWERRLKRPHPAGAIFIVASVLFLALFLVWAQRSEVDEVARGLGRVIPTSQVQLVQNLEGGIVSDILVSQGARVEKGQVLLRIDPTGASAAFREGRSKILAHKAAMERLGAEAEDRKLEFSEEVRREASDAAASETRLYEARRSELQNNLQVLRKQFEIRQQESVELESKIAGLEVTFNLLKQELALTEQIEKQSAGTLSPVELLKLRREFNIVQSELRSARAALPKVRKGAEEVQQRIEEKRATYRSEALNQLNERRGTAAALGEALTAVEDRISRTEVRSPATGIIKQLKISTEGGVVKPGDSLIEIVPIEDTLLVEAKISPADVAFVKPEQAVNVRFTAYDFSIYGSLPGLVEQVTADSIIDEKQQVFYLVRVRTSGQLVDAAGRPLAIIPGMVAEVDILTGKKTVLDYIFKPFRRIRDRALQER